LTRKERELFAIAEQSAEGLKTASRTRETLAGKPVSIVSEKTLASSEHIVALLERLNAVGRLSAETVLTVSLALSTLATRRRSTPRRRFGAWAPLSGSRCCSSPDAVTQLYRLRLITADPLSLRYRTVCVLPCKTTLITPEIPYSLL
jgi:hypothetical protein